MGIRNMSSIRLLKKSTDPQVSDDSPQSRKLTRSAIRRHIRDGELDWEFIRNFPPAVIEREDDLRYRTIEHQFQYELDKKDNPFLSDVAGSETVSYPPFHLRGEQFQLQLIKGMAQKTPFYSLVVFRWEEPDHNMVYAINATPLNSYEAIPGPDYVEDFVLRYLSALGD